MHKFWFLLVLGLAFAIYAGDKDDDGIPNKVDECPKDAEDFDGFDDRDGCPDFDNDKDKLCDPWVAEQNQLEKYSAECKGTDKCPDIAEDHDGFQDTDGCPDLNNDEDGVPDLKDKCPMEPEDMDGFEDSDGCPDPDNDKDAILDLKDKCPNAPEDKDGFEDEEGCPDPDNDKDGIPDIKDECPNEAETVNDFKEEDGCPDVAINPLRSGQTFPYIGFRTGTSELTFESQRDLDSIAIKLQAYPEQNLRFNLYHKFTGKKTVTLELLAEQQKSLVEYMVSKGVDGSRIVLQDYSESGYTAVQGTPLDYNKTSPMSIDLLPKTPAATENIETPMPEIHENQ